jgi:hypothetical protein
MAPNPFIDKNDVELKKRYNICDSQGHQSPDRETNFCNYCFRHLNYKTPETDRKFSNRGLPLILIPCDAPLRANSAREEIQHQRLIDYFDGLNKLSSELSLKE